MIYLLSWTGVLLLIGLWSVALWALHAAAAWAVGQAGAIKGAVPEALPAWPPWLEAWLPPEWADAPAAAMAGMAPVVEWLTGLAPWLVDGLGILAWVVWGLGTAALLAIGAALHGLVALWRRRSRPTLPPGTGPIALR